MVKIDLYDTSGKKVGKIVLPSEIFAAKLNPRLMAQAVRVYLANQRQGGAKTKTRSEVNRTKAKWYRQKGTGRARHGSRAAPIFVGGGVAHGPTGKENYQLNMSQRMKKAALFSGLTDKLKNQKIVVVKGLEKIEPKTKKMKKILENLGITGEVKKTLLILPEKLENVILAGRNLAGLNLISANLLNVYQVLNNEQLIFMENSIDKLKETFLKK